MKSIFSILFISIAAITFSQNYLFKPEWKPGEVKQILISQVEKEYENGVLVSDSTLNSEAKLTVLEEHSDHYKLEILYENDALKTVLNFYSKIDQDMEWNEYKNLKLLYKVDKETADYELLNWAQVNHFMKESFDLFLFKIKKTLPEKADIVAKEFASIEQTFEDKESIENYMKSKIGYFFTPYHQNFKLGETIVQKDIESNPFNPMQEISVSTLLKLESVNENLKTCTLVEIIELDLSEFVETLKTLISALTESFGGDAKKAKESEKILDSFEMNVENKTEIFYNYQTTWVEGFVNKASIIVTDPRDNKKTRSEVIIQTKVK